MNGVSGRKEEMGGDWIRFIYLFFNYMETNRLKYDIRHLTQIMSKVTGKELPMSVHPVNFAVLDCDEYLFVNSMIESSRKISWIVWFNLRNIVSPAEQANNSNIYWRRWKLNNASMDIDVQLLCLEYVYTNFRPKFLELLNDLSSFKSPEGLRDYFAIRCFLNFEEYSRDQKIDWQWKLQDVSREDIWILEGFSCSITNSLNEETRDVPPDCPSVRTDIWRNIIVNICNDFMLFRLKSDRAGS